MVIRPECLYNFGTKPKYDFVPKVAHPLHCLYRLYFVCSVSFFMSLVVYFLTPFS